MTTYILAATVIVSLYCLSNREWFEKLQLQPYRVQHQKTFYELFSHGFVHADYIHLFVNMFVLWMMGGYVERVFRLELGDLGSVYYGVLYFGGIIAATVPSLQKQKDNPYYAAVGASGAVSAVVFAFILLDPLQMLYVYGVLPIPAVVFGILYVAYERWQDKKGGDHIAHDAHLAGAVYGFLISILFNPQWFKQFINQLMSFI